MQTKQRGRRFFAVLLTLAMLLSAVPLTGLTAAAAEMTSGDFQYEVLSETDKTCEITGYTGSATELVIPSELDGYTVTSIGDRAFENCGSLTSIDIPDSVTSIGDGAFAFCESLTSIDIPDSVTSIGNYAFYWCDSLTSIDIPDSVTSIGDKAFWDCDSLASIHIPDSVTSIGNETFRECDSLTSIIVANGNPNYASVDGVLFNKDRTELIQYPIEKPDTEYRIPFGVTSIGDAAFAYCDSMTSIMIPDSVTSIGDGAFAFCESLISVMIPNSVAIIGNSGFIGCNALTSIDIPNSVERIGNYTFHDCDSLASVTIGNGVVSIGNQAFWDCDSLTNISIPNSVMSIGELAFANCDSLTSITIPDSVTTMGEAVFTHCPNLTVYGYADSYAETYAAENDIPFVALVSAEDTTSGIIVMETVNGVLSEDTELNVELTENTETQVSYNITLMQNGVEIQLAGTVTVKIPVPDGMDGNACKVYREEADGSYTDMNAAYQDGYMVFTTDHFSVYVLTAENLQGTPGDVNADGKVDAVDARWVLQAAAGMRTLENATAADVNTDSKIDAVDARWILQAAAGMRTLDA